MFTRPVANSAFSRPTFRHLSLSFRRVLPPRFLRFSLHEPDGGDKRVQQARIVALPGKAAQIVVHRIWVTSQQLGGRGNSQLAQAGGDGGADVSQ